MWRCALLLLFSLNYLTAVSQNVVSAITTDAQTLEAIPFVNLGIANKGVGTVSSGDGRFTLHLDGQVTPLDTITISHIGYKTRRIVCADLKTAKQLLLEPESHTLHTVQVKFAKPRHKILGRHTKGLGLMHMNLYSAREKTADDRLSKEFGMQIRLKQDCRLDDLNFNITSNEFKSIKFRLHFYKVENGLPTALLIDQDIIFDIKDGFLGWYKLDLKPYKLYLDGSDGAVAVTLQWLESEKLREDSKYFGLSTAASATETSFFREKSMDTWKTGVQSLSFYLNAQCH